MTIFDLDQQLLRCYFRFEAYERERLRLQRIWHPETFSWAKKGKPPMMTETKRIREEELARIGQGEPCYQEMLSCENGEKARLIELAEGHPLWYHFERIKGLGLRLCGSFVAAGGDIRRPCTVSAFWRGMGLDVLNADLTTDKGTLLIAAGGVPRRIRGSGDIERKIPALPHVTRIGEQIRQQINRGDRKLHWWYEHFKEREPLEKKPLYRHKSALRLTQKVLYACLWREWRRANDLPAPDPYAFAILKHDTGHMVRIHNFYEDGKE